MQMRIQCDCPSVEHSMRALLERQLHLALSRYTPEIRSVHVKIREVPGARGATFECRVAIRTSWRQTITLQHSGRELVACATHAAALAGRSMHRMVALRTVLPAARVKQI